MGSSSLPHQKKLHFITPSRLHHEYVCSREVLLPCLLIYYLVLYIHCIHISYKGLGSTIVIFFKIFSSVFERVLHQKKSQWGTLTIIILKKILLKRLKKKSLEGMRWIMQKLQLVKDSNVDLTVENWNSKILPLLIRVLVCFSLNRKIEKIIPLYFPSEISK